MTATWSRQGLHLQTEKLLIRTGACEQPYPVVISFFLCGNPPPVVRGPPLSFWQSNERSHVPRYGESEHDSCPDTICCDLHKFLSSLIEGGLCKSAPAPLTCLCFASGIPKGTNGLIAFSCPFLPPVLLLLLLIYVLLLLIEEAVTPWMAVLQGTNSIHGLARHS